MRAGVPGRANTRVGAAGAAGAHTPQVHPGRGGHVTTGQVPACAARDSRRVRNEVWNEALERAASDAPASGAPGSLVFHLRTAEPVPRVPPARGLRIVPQGATALRVVVLLGEEPRRGSVEERRCRARIATRTDTHSIATYRAPERERRVRASTHRTQCCATRAVSLRGAQDVRRAHTDLNRPAWPAIPPSAYALPSDT